MTEKTTAEIGLLTPEQVAKILKITPTTVRRFIRDREIPAHKIGKQWRINFEDLRDYMWSGYSFAADAVMEEDMAWLEDEVRAVLAESESAEPN